MSDQANQYEPMTELPMSQYEQDMMNVHNPPSPNTKSYYRLNPLEEMEKQVAGNSKRLTLLSEGIDFLRDNPAFVQFIALVRKGSISI